MPDAKSKAKKVEDKILQDKILQDKILEGKITASRYAEMDTRFKQLGIKSPGNIRGMMDELGDINICFLE